MAKDLEWSIEICVFKPLNVELFSLHVRVFSQMY
jgi:hypothetical protein